MIEVRGGPFTADGPETRIDIELAHGKADLEVTIVKAESSNDAAERLGRWVFENPGAGQFVLAVKWIEQGIGSVTLSTAAGLPTNASAADVNPDAVIRPEMTVLLEHGPDSVVVPVKITNTRLLESYYQQESHQDEYVVEHPFFMSFHKARLRTLGRLFRKHIKAGSRVLDIGSGYSIFFLITTDWEFDITCCDLDSAAMEKMRGLAPQWEWVVADALDLPWEDGSFDAIYAGEIIEHVADTEAALIEWKRVLKPGGVFILTTPNRDRLLARSNHEVSPVHPEHVREMNLNEARSALCSQGFTVIESTGIYLELLLNWWRPPGKRVDLLTAHFQKPGHDFLYRLAMDMGHIIPSRAYDLVFTCRKH